MIGTAEPVGIHPGRSGLTFYAAGQLSVLGASATAIVDTLRDRFFPPLVTRFVGRARHHCFSYPVSLKAVVNNTILGFLRQRNVLMFFVKVAIVKSLRKILHTHSVEIPVSTST